ncbi:MAG TPA: hypothetical protein PKW80_16415 [Bacteroidales bacterium]|nr:hypothetical protein [Bacteroidales bacterium]
MIFHFVLFVLTQKVPIRQLADKKIFSEPCLLPGRLRTGYSLTPCFGKLSTPHIFLPPHFAALQQFEPFQQTVGLLAISYRFFSV